MHRVRSVLRSGTKHHGMLRSHSLKPLGLVQLFLESLARGGRRTETERWLPTPCWPGFPEETWLSVTVAHPLLVIFSSMWHLGLLPASDGYTCVNTHTVI